MKKIAIITGATGGLGKEFVDLMTKEPLDEIWVIARNIQNLNGLQEKYGNKIITLSKDLSNYEDILTIKAKIEYEKPDIYYLINNAGIGEKGLSYEYSLEEINETITVNCTSVVTLCSICIPYMYGGSHILNISSQSAFQPVPYINLYASSKVFIRSYSRALNVELKKRKIVVTAVCPGWIDTDMLIKEINGKKVKFYGLVSPHKVAVKAIYDTKKGKDMSVCTFYVKCMHMFAKIFPQRLAMKTWCASIKKYIL